LAISKSKKQYNQKIIINLI